MMSQCVSVQCFQKLEDVSCFCFYCFGAFKKTQRFSEKNVNEHQRKGEKEQLVSGSEGLHRLMFNIRNNTKSVHRIELKMCF